MLDVSRHFFSVEDVKRFIDRMVLYKFNVFTGTLLMMRDGGLKSNLPQLTSKGAWRVARTGKFGTRPAPKSEEPIRTEDFIHRKKLKKLLITKIQTYYRGP